MVEAGFVAAAVNQTSRNKTISEKMLKCCIIIILLQSDDCHLVTVLATLFTSSFDPLLELNKRKIGAAPKLHVNLLNSISI